MEENDSKIDEVANLLFNLQSGLHPYYLQDDEIQLLQNKYGENWLEELGYTQEWLNNNMPF